VLTERFRSARRDTGECVLEGFHAVKHAIRFGADLRAVAAHDPEAVLTLAADLAPDVAADLGRLMERVTLAEFADLVPDPPPTGVVAIAVRPRVDPGSVVAASGTAPVVFLERPNHLGNLGAAVRVAAAAGAAGVVTTGERDPWHPAALRGSAGLHFALPVVRADGLPETARPVVAVDPEGTPLPDAVIPEGAVLAFGSERTGLSGAILGRAGRRVAIPMRTGVSSLNLATAVAVLLYHRH
jgi:TrmH family RNA methyltransferase